MFGQKTNSHLILAAKRLEKMEKALAGLTRRRKNPSVVGQARKLITDLDRRRGQFEATTRQMKNHISSAEARLKKLSVASTASWSAFQTALIKSQRAFSNANRKAGKALRRAVK